MPDSDNKNRPWPEVCTSCGDSNWVRVVVPETGPIIKLCRSCRTETAKAPPDVFLPGNKTGGVMYEENIADPKTGKPIPFYDKASKAAAMKQAGVREAGDKIHGARNEYGSRKTYFT